MDVVRGAGLLCVLDGLVRPVRRLRRARRALEEPGAVARVRLALEGGRVVAERLVGRPERRRTLRGAVEQLERGADQVLGIVVVGPVVERVEVVPGDDGGDLVARAGLLEVSRHRQVACLAIAAGQRLVGDGAHERLHEPVLAPLGREPVGVDLEDLLADQLREDGVQVRDAAHRLEPFACERQAERGGVLHHLPLGRCEGVETRRDQRLQAGWRVERAEVDARWRRRAPARSGRRSG